MCEQKKIFVLDRYESGIAVLIGDDGAQINAPGLKGREGDVFELVDGELIASPDEQEAREKRIRGKMDSIFRKGRL